MSSAAPAEKSAVLITRTASDESVRLSSIAMFTLEEKLQSGALRMTLKRPAYVDAIGALRARMKVRQGARVAAQGVIATLSTPSRWLPKRS